MYHAVLEDAWNAGVMGLPTGGKWLMLKEFKEFAIKGNVVDMAVGIIIGAAFGTIVKSLVADVIMPPIGMLLGDVDFSNLFVVLKGGATRPAPTPPWPTPRPPAR